MQKNDRYQSLEHLGGFGEIVFTDYNIPVRQEK
jgi:hypothetical protein